MFEIQLNIFNLIIMASVFIGLTFSLLLIFSKRINKTANQFLGLASFVIVLWNVWVLSHDLDFFRYAPKFYLIPLNFSLALGPLIYFYTKSISNFGFDFAKRDWLHIIPVAFELLIHIIISIEAVQKNILATSTNAFFTWIPLIQLLAILSVVMYSFYALREIRMYHKWLKENYSNAHRYNLHWLYRLLLVFAIFWMLWIPYILVDFLFFDFKLGIPDYYPLYILMAVITIWISTEAYLKTEIILVEAKPNIQEKKETPSNEIIEKAKWLEQQMESNLVYLNPELTLSTLAETLEMHPNRLSKIINDGLQKSFSDFVNEYRTKAVVSRLNNPKYNHITLLGISFECGFNSKTTFNRVFKELMGVTPFEYKKSLLK